MEKTKILFFMDGIGNAGGIQEMTINWVKNFDKEKFTVDILSYDTGKNDNYKERFEKIGGNVYIIPTYLKKGMFFKSLKETNDFFKKHNEYKILHAHASSKAIFILLFAKINGIKHRILHSHATQFVNKSKCSIMLGNILKPIAVKLSNYYFACSTEAGEFLFGKKRMHNKGKIIPNGINLDRFIYDSKIRRDVRKELNIKDDELLIGNVGRFRPQKNHEFLIEIFSYIVKQRPYSKLLLLGNGELFETIQRKVEKYELTENVLFLGFRNDVNRIITACDVMVMPSLFEGLPVTAVEAQALGIPIVLSDTISKDTQIIDEVRFVGLNQNAEMWGKTIFELAKIGVNLKARDIVKEKKYEECASAQILMENYERMIINE